MRLHDVAKNAAGDLQVLSDEELKELQRVLLIILDDILQICNKYHLHLAIIGGTAIGALRHKGFIPWDDDIDLAMPRKDFEKLRHIIKEKYQDKYSVLHPQQKHNYGRVIPKIRLKKTEYRTILERDLDECGIFIDIFPIENVFDNPVKMYFQGFMSMALGFALSCRRIYQGRQEWKKLSKNISFKIKCGIGVILSFASLEQWARWTDYWYSCCKDENSRRISVPSDGKHFFGGIHLREEFCSFCEISFEGRRCFLPGNYDSYLRGYYKDYMQMPPKEKRERNKYIALDFGKYGSCKKEKEYD